MPDLGLVLGHSRLCQRHIDLMLSHFGVFCGLSWPLLGKSFDYIGIILGHIGLCWDILGHVGTVWCTSAGLPLAVELLTLDTNFATFQVAVQTISCQAPTCRKKREKSDCCNSDVGRTWTCMMLDQFACGTPGPRIYKSCPKI